MKPKEIKSTLKNSIHVLNKCRWLFSSNPEKDFTRNRKLPFDKIVSAVLAFRSGTLNHEIIDFFGLDSDIATSSAFIQQRAKILPEAFECLFQHFTDRVQSSLSYKGYRLLAVDGSDLQSAANSNDPDSFFPGTDNQKSYNLLHINAMYDLLQRIYVGAIVQNEEKQMNPEHLLPW